MTTGFENDINMKMKTILILSCIIVLLAGTVLAVLSHPAFGLFRHRSTDRIQQSPNWRDGMFQNQVPTPQFTGNTNMFKAMWTMLAEHDSARVPTKPVAAVKTDLHTLPTDYDWLVWFGHSSYMFCLKGKRFLVDPVLKAGFPSSLMMKPFKGTDIYRPNDLPDIDYLIVTHEHWDHLDYATLRDLRNRVGHVFCPLGIADYLHSWGFPDNMITEMDWYDTSSIAKDQSRITCLPSRHFSNRLFRRDQTLWASFLVESGGRKVYVAGDGGYDGHFKEIHEKFGSVDLALLENGQYNPNWKYIHTTPEDLEKVILDLQAKQVFTVHHGKFALSTHPWNEPDSVAKNIAERHNVRILDAPIGTVVDF